MKNESFHYKQFNHLLAHFHFHGQRNAFSILHNENIIHEFAVEKNTSEVFKTSDIGLCTFYAIIG
ncbi:MAG: hypothetical protein DRR08_00500 [Candidatus Parabeggiatoa sp. nov. 2]|nr:MAG: hypothetical protein B6247_02845 [Beggiatoa sp. 4572_84]RKZ64530.1 MAG: hypothetical protein DRR08_00500 [Gammaproteobacteria bacterium]